MAVTDPMKMVTTSSLSPLRGITKSTTSPAGYVTSQQYDAVGRLTQVSKPGLSAPAAKFTYAVSNTAPSVITSSTLNFDGSYRQSVALLDASMRTRETQVQTPSNGRIVTDTVYNSTGDVAMTTAPYFNPSPVSSEYVQAQVGQIPSATGFAYDGAGRTTSAISYALGTETWRTTTRYGGNFTTTIPPAGATPTTVFADARGRTTDLLRYRTGVDPNPLTATTAQYDRTRYTHYPSGNPATVVDPAGNTWSYQYNLLGQRTSSIDPDTGTTTFVYDNAGQLTTTTDARGGQTTVKYDDNGRKTASYNTTGGATPALSNQLTAHTYDTLKKGFPTATTSYSGGDTITSTVLAYNSQGKPQAVRFNLTGEGTTLVPGAGLTTSYGYSLTGFLTSQTYPAAGGLPQETVNYGYHPFGEPKSAGTYVQAVGYTELGQPKQYTLPANGNTITVGMSYDSQTQALTEIKTTDNTVVDKLNYTYGNSTVSKGAGLVTSIANTQNAGAAVDTQCFTYDYAARLNSAWSATDNCATVPASGNSTMVGGPNRYWQSWTYDAAGNRATQTDHDPTNAANNTVATYHYPTSGLGGNQPHTLTKTTATGPNAATATASYEYDSTGNTESITGGPTGDQSLEWNDQNKLASNTTSAGPTTYAYGADGSLVVRRNPGQTTLFLGDQQLVLNTTTNTVTATRYYTIGGTVIASRTSGVNGGNTQILVPDRQNTNQLAIDTNTHSITRRQYMPFGAARGTTPTLWPGGNRGFHTGTPDPTTQLLNLGARQYNPNSGRFLSADPIFAPGNPNQTNGYSYADNNPTTGSDPTGLFCDGCNTPDNPNSVAGKTVGCSMSTNGSCGSGGGGGGGKGGGKGGGGAEKWPGTFKNLVLHSECTGWCEFEQYSYGFASQAGAAVKDMSNLVVNVGECTRAFDWGKCKHNVETAVDIVKFSVTDPRGFAEALWDAQFGAIESAAEDGNYAEAAGRASFEVVNLIAGLKGLTKAAQARKLTDVTSSGPCSFDGDTEVLMADGATKPIQDITPGDNVMAADPKTGRQGPRQVTATWPHSDTLYQLVLADGTTIDTTEDHPFWNNTDQQWQPADALDAGDDLVTNDGHSLSVVGIRLDTARHGHAYNLTVDDLHTYYVLAGETPVLVHNADRCINPKISMQKQGRHIKDDNLYGGGGYFNSHKEAQEVLDAYHTGSATVLGVTSRGHTVVQYRGVTGYNNNPQNGFLDQATNVFMIKGTSSPSVVPINPNWTGGN